MTLANLSTLFIANNSQAKGISVIYQTLLGGVPNVAGFTFLINENNTSNFGSGTTTVFNDENIYINIANALVQGNADAAAAFNVLANGTTLVDQITSLYKAIIPTADQSTDGLAYLTSTANLTFYTDVASERGITSDNGPAIIAMASLLKIAVDGYIGVGNSVNDLLAAVYDNSAVFSGAGGGFTPIETADGTNFDVDDIGFLFVDPYFVNAPHFDDITIKNPESIYINSRDIEYEVRFIDKDSPSIGYSVHEVATGYVTTLSAPELAGINRLIELAANAGETNNVPVNIKKLLTSMSGVDRMLDKISEISYRKSNGDLGALEYSEKLKVSLTGQLIDIFTQPTKAFSLASAGTAAIDTLIGFAHEVSRETALLGTYNHIVYQSNVARYGIDGESNKTSLDFLITQLLNLSGSSSSLFHIQDVQRLEVAFLRASIFEKTITNLYSTARELETGNADLIPDDVAGAFSAILGAFNPLLGVGIAVVDLVDNFVGDIRNINLVNKTTADVAASLKKHILELAQLTEETVDPERSEKYLEGAKTQSILGTNESEYIIVNQTEHQVLAGGIGDDTYIAKAQDIDGDTLLDFNSGDKIFLQGQVSVKKTDVSILNKLLTVHGISNDADGKISIALEKIGDVETTVSSTSVDGVVGTLIEFNDINPHKLFLSDALSSGGQVGLVEVKSRDNFDLLNSTFSYHTHEFRDGGSGGNLAFDGHGNLSAANVGFANYVTDGGYQNGQNGVRIWTYDISDGVINTEIYDGSYGFYLDPVSFEYLDSGAIYAFGNRGVSNGLLAPEPWQLHLEKGFDTDFIDTSKSIELPVGYAELKYMEKQSSDPFSYKINIDDTANIDGSRIVGLVTNHVDSEQHLVQFLPTDGFNLASYETLVEINSPTTLNAITATSDRHLIGGGYNVGQTEYQIYSIDESSGSTNLIGVLPRGGSDFVYSGTLADLELFLA